MCVSFLFQRTLKTSETRLLTENHLYLQDFKYDIGTELEYTVIVLGEVKLIFTSSSEHCRKERDSKNTVISVFTIITVKIICWHGFKSTVYLLCQDSCGPGH